jgi:F0F1-type ATP synthase membrane subunit b/b'
MNWIEILVGVVTILLALASSLIATKKTEATMEERTRNIDEKLNSHIESHATEMVSLKSDIASLINGQRSSTAERIEFILDYIKRVESNKADDSKVDMVISTIQRVENKVDRVMDLLIRRDGK